MKNRRNTSGELHYKARRNILYVEFPFQGFKYLLLVYLLYPHIS
jgi:hypothetical protein